LRIKSWKCMAASLREGKVRIFAGVTTVYSGAQRWRRPAPAGSGTGTPAAPLRRWAGRERFPGSLAVWLARLRRDPGDL